MTAVCLIEHIASEARTYHEPPPTRCTQHDQAAVIRWRPEQPGTAWITLATSHTPHTHATLRALEQGLRDAGLTAVYGERGQGHVLPGAVDLGGGLWRYDLIDKG